MGLLSAFTLGSPFMLPMVGLAVYYLAWIIYARTLHPLAKIPGPWLASFSRIWYMIQIYRGDMDKTQRQLHAQYGPLLRIAPNEIVVADPSCIKSIYRTQSAFDKTDFYPVWNTQAFSKHRDVFTEPSDKAHSQRRRIFNHVYSLANVLKSEKYIDTVSEMFLERLREHAEKPEPAIDLGRWMQMYAYDVIGELYFGRMFGFLENSEDFHGWIHSLDLLTPFICMTAVAPKFVRPMIMASALVVPGSLQALRAIENIATSAKEMVAGRFGTVDLETMERREDIAGQLYGIHVEKGAKVDFMIGDIEQEAYNAIFAGSDSTSIAFRSLFYFLMKEPEAYKEIQEEIDSAFAEGRLRHPVKYSEAIKLPLLCGAIKEALRIHPAVQLSMGRVVPAEGLEVCGTYIPPGYWVGMNPGVVHLDKSIFGQDADKFRPRRWLQDEGVVRDMGRHMLAFGAGTRTCIGKNISLSELHKLVPEVLRGFELELVEKEKDWKTTCLGFCKQEFGLVRLRKREL